MIKVLFKLATVAALGAIGASGLLFYQYTNREQAKIVKLEEEKQALKELVTRISAESRLADIVVTRQRTVEGVLESTLLFVEMTKDGKPLSPREFTVRGKNIHIDHLLVKFRNEFVEAGDSLRGKSIALFDKIYGDAETPAQGHRIDAPQDQAVRIPEVYRGSSPATLEFETKLWANFWRLFSDDSFRSAQGVEVVQGQGVFGPFTPGVRYSLTLSNSGGITLRQEPIPQIYREALDRAAAGASNGAASVRN